MVDWLHGSVTGGGEIGQHRRSLFSLELPLHFVHGTLETVILTWKYGNCEKRKEYVGSAG